MEVMNVYARNKVEAPGFLPTHRPSRDSLLAGDNNPHHEGWYGAKAIECDGVLRGSNRQADMTVKWTTEHQYVRIKSIGPQPIFRG